MCCNQRRVLSELTDSLLECSGCSWNVEERISMAKTITLHNRHNAVGFVVKGQVTFSPVT